MSITNEEYIEGGGEQCPACGRIGTIQANGPLSSDLRQPMACIVCGSEWIDHYQLALTQYTALLDYSVPSTENEA